MRRADTHFSLNRWILLGCLAGSLLLPLVTVPAGWSLREALTVEELAAVVPVESPEIAVSTKTSTITTAKAKLKSEAKAGVIQEAELKPTNASGLKAFTPATAASGFLPPAPTTSMRLLWWEYLAGVAIFGLSEEEFRKALAGYKSAGYGKPDMDKMIELRIHGVSNEYIKEVSDLGFKGLSLDKITKAKIHGLSAEFVRDMASAGLNNLDFDEVISMSIHGVSSEYVNELKKLGYDNLSADDVVGACIHGVRTEH